MFQKNRGKLYFTDSSLTLRSRSCLDRCIPIFTFVSLESKDLHSHSTIISKCARNSIEPRSQKKKKTKGEIHANGVRKNKKKGARTTKRARPAGRSGAGRANVDRCKWFSGALKRPFPSKSGQIA